MKMLIGLLSAQKKWQCICISFIINTNQFIMKKSFVLILTVLLLGSCAVFGPRAEFSKGMSERQFLRQNKEAVISTLEDGFTTYRVNRGDTFFVLVTFENEKLIRLEEREVTPAWMPSQPQNSNIE